MASEVEYGERTKGGMWDRVCGLEEVDCQIGVQK